MNARIAAAAPPADYRRILDLGCGHGNSTLGYLTVFPDAEVHGLDISGPMVRYAHWRAESQGKRAHFSQQNAERTDFPTGHFDLVSATILFHEVPPAAARNIVGEAHRLLAPGGAFVIADIPDNRYSSPLQQHLNDWQTRHNGEPHFTSFFRADLIGIMQNAGFVNVREYAANPDGVARFPWLTVGEKPA
ncbi:MAG: class I SAM-dependent methyltransferase [Thermomicrobiales bacterium]|nr:class I SAM-dependent methyltransferase [Thermomicrobiales bacterium]